MQPLEPSVAVTIPSFKESETIFSLVSELLAFPFIDRIVVVDDTPDNSTIDALLTLKNEPRLIIIHRKRKAGRGSAVLEGIQTLVNHHAHDYIIEMDADFSHHPKEIPGLINKIHSSQAGLVVASRYLPQSAISNWPIKRKLFSKFSNIFAKSLLRIPISDYTNGFRIYTYEAATLLAKEELLGTGFIALSDVLVKLYYNGFNITEIPTHFYNRTRGESALGIKEITNAFLGIFKIYLAAQKLKSRKSHHEKKYHLQKN